jgi:hypothetical protein
MVELRQSEILRAAAARLRALQRWTTPAPWEAGERCVWTESAGTVISDSADGAGGVQNPADTAWIALMAPHIAEPLAAMLEGAAAEYARYENRGWSWDHVLMMVRSSDHAALRLARLIESAPVFSAGGE